MNTSYYFSHDTNARNDEKILCLRADYGIEGYGAYWMLLEMMFDNQETSLSHKHLRGIAFSMNMDLKQLKNFIKSCINYGLFDSDGVTFWSDSLRKRKGTYILKRDKKVEAGLKSAEVRRSKSGAKNVDISDNDNFDELRLECPDDSIDALSEDSDIIIEDEIEHNSNTVSTQLNTRSTELNKLNINKIKEKEKYNIISSHPKSKISEEGINYSYFFKSLLPSTQKVSKSSLISWAETYDKLIRIDKSPHEEIYKLTEWALKDHFWGEQGNFLSACKLRNKSKDGVMYYDIFLQKFNQGNKINEAPKIKKPELPAWFTEAR